MTPVKRTLIGIALFVVIGLGSFIWFIANWDSGSAKPIGMGPENASSVLARAWFGQGVLA